MPSRWMVGILEPHRTLPTKCGNQRVRGERGTLYGNLGRCVRGTLVTKTENNAILVFFHRAVDLLYEMRKIFTVEKTEN